MLAQFIIVGGGGNGRFRPLQPTAYCFYRFGRDDAINLGKLEAQRSDVGGAMALFMAYIGDQSGVYGALERLEQDDVPRVVRNAAASLRISRKEQTEAPVPDAG